MFYSPFASNLELFIRFTMTEPTVACVSVSSVPVYPFDLILVCCRHFSSAVCC